VGAQGSTFWWARSRFQQIYLEDNILAFAGIAGLHLFIGPFVSRIAGQLYKTARSIEI
jgi:hypothetical protein